MTTLAMVTDLAERAKAEAIEAVLITGDLAKLTPEQRVSYYRRVCESLGLNPLTKPFAYITLNGKLVLYALKDCTEQLRSLHGVSITELTSQRLEDVFVVTAKAAKADGRTDAATGAVAIAGLKGESLANALMKAETKAKRRATLSICGLGMLDETEAEPLAAQQAPSAPVVIEAPTRIALPEGTHQILRTQSTTRGKLVFAEAVVVDWRGEEQTYALPVDPTGKVGALCEALAQEQCPVEITTRVNKNGRTVVEEIKRFVMTPSELPPAPTGVPAL